MMQNDNFYLAEAFNRLSLLNEDAFDLSADKGVVDELQSFVADDIEAPYEEEVIDVAAEDEDELQDSYVGKVILQCDCCHAKIYKDPNEVILDETGELANVNEICPVCNCEQGWKVIGKIEPYEESEEEKPEEEEVEVEAEFSDDEIGEALREALNPDEQRELDGIVYNHLADAAYEAEVDHELDVHRKDMEKAEAAFNDDFYFGDVDESCKNEECDKDLEEKCDESLDNFNELKDQLNAGAEMGDFQDDYNQESALNDIKDALNKGEITQDQFNKLKGIIGLDESIEEKVDPELKAGKPVKSGKWEYQADPKIVKKAINTLYDLPDAEFDKFNDMAQSAYIDKDPEAIKYVKRLFNKLHLPMWVLKAFVEAWDDQNESLTEKVEVNINDETAAEDAVKIEDSEQEPIKEELGDKAAEDAEKLVDPEKDPILNEDVRNISVDVDGENHIEIEPKEDGGVEIEVNPSEEAPVEGEGEMIAPLDDQDIEAIEGNDGELPEEEPVEDEFEIDDFDEESFDELGESFLKRVYDNVGSFNTTKVTQNKGKLVVEGLIKFNSGKEKATSFVFENYRNTKRGKTMIEGMNETFSKSNRAFLLKGILENKKYTCESLTYNYNVQQLNESNESETVHVYGRAIKR